MRFCILLIAAGLALSPASAQESLEGEISRLMDVHGVPGLAMAIVDGDSILLRAWGHADPGARRPVDTDTPFRIASVAKPLVAATAALEVAEGRVAFDEEVGDLVPHPGGFDGPITLAHLLTHTAGFDERWVGYAAADPSEMQPLREYLTDRLPHRGWPAGEAVSYSNHGMSLAALALEDAAGRPFATVAEERLFRPLGMDGTRFLTSGGQLPEGVAEPLRCRDGECESYPHAYSHAYPAGLAFSTARDMAAFIEAVLQADPTRPGLGQLIPERFSPGHGLPGMSFGFMNQTHQGVRFLAHAGSAPGYRSLLLIAPESGFGFFFATNGGSDRFGEELRDLLLTTRQGKPAQTKQIRSIGADISHYAGSWEQTRYSHTTVERFPQVFQNSLAIGGEGDTLMVYSGGRARAYLETAPAYFENLDGTDALAFDTVRGQPTLYRTSWVYGAGLPATYEFRGRWGPRFLNEYVSWLLALPPILAIVWILAAGTAALRRRRRGLSAPREGFLPGAFAATALVGVGLFVAFGFGFVARSNRLMQTGELFFGLPEALQALIWIPPVHAALAVVVAVATVVAWREGWWGWFRRSVFTLVATALVLQVVFLVSWNYLPISY